MSKKKINLCIVKASEYLRQHLLRKFSEVDNVKSLSEISADAAQYNITIEKAALSKYLNHKHPVKGGLTQEQILFLCLRHGIDVSLTIKLDKESAEVKFQKLWRKTVQPQQV